MDGLVIAARFIELDPAVMDDRISHLKRAAFDEPRAMNERGAACQEQRGEEGILHAGTSSRNTTCPRSGKVPAAVAPGATRIIATPQFEPAEQAFVVVAVPVVALVFASTPKPTPTVPLPAPAGN